jgi:hypothetical protein
MPFRGRTLFPVVCLALFLPWPARAEPGTVAVRHLDDCQGWHVTVTANFRLFHASPRDLAEKAIRTAERTRAALLRKWFGAAGDDWLPRCDICLYPSADEFARQTGVPPHVAGFTNVRVEHGRPVVRRIELNGAVPDLVAAVLPHEVTHAVVAGRFGDENLPQWANEGMAVLAEPRAKIDGHLRQLPHLRDEEELFPTADLLRLQGYPAPHRVGAFYAQSVSLVEFLSRQKGPRTFTRFLRDGLEDGFATALDRYYGWDFDQLERRWRDYAFEPPGERPGAALSGAAVGN